MVHGRRHRLRQLGGLVVNQIDWALVLKHVTPRNVAKWIAVIGFGVFVIICLSWMASYAWSVS
jgi:hypothetical protein